MGLLKTVIMAGGKGTRISSVASDIPKPMIPIGGMPVLEHELRCLADQGYRDIIITVGHLHEAITQYFGDGSGVSPATGEPFGVHIEYFIETAPLGNAGALFQLKDKLTEDFLLLNADAMFDVDFDRFVKFHREKGGLATLFAHPSSHPYDSGLLCLDDSGCVQQWLTKEDPRPEYYRNQVNAGMHILSPRILDMKPSTEKVDLDRQLLKPLAGTGQLFAYISSEYVREMGTPERYAAVCRDFELGHIAARNLKRKQKAVFLDRDGTINRSVGFLRDIDDFELLPGAAEAIRAINNSDYLAIVVTNQPVIARGEVTYAELRQIHDKMETLLGAKGAYIDGLYYCPHHPDKGFEGEIAELKIDCDCRKPKPGMLLKAAQEFNIDLQQSWMIGDRDKDVFAGQAAGCRTGLISDGADAAGEFGQTVTGQSLLEIVNRILSR